MQLFTKQLKLLTAAFCLLSYMVLGVSGQQSYVICQETDGSISLEVALNGRCADRLTKKTANTPVRFSPQRMPERRGQFTQLCNDCTDTPLFVSGQDGVFLSEQTAVNDSQPQFFLGTRYALILATLSDWIPTWGWPHPPPLALHSIAFLKTTIFRQ
ncbi:MAG: hypothetical protein R2857_13440 [Vampirovibrionales bacterium]|nr:hypothetical protein [Cyanobacteria bacterium HKST-UBA03]